MSGALEVLYEDNHLLAVNKPARMPIVPDSSGDESLLDRARAYVKAKYAKPGEAFLAVVHRLDRPVSGVVVFARTSKAAARLAEQFREGRAKKTYWAVGSGALPSESGDSGELEQWLLKDEERNVVRVVPLETAGAKRALTRWRVLARAADRTLFEFEPDTGRSHQLRVAAASLGCPLLGDLKYGAGPRLASKSIALHAARLELEHPTHKEPLVLEAPVPAREVWDLVPKRAPPR